MCEIENKLKTIISGSLQEYFGTSWLVKGLPKNTYTKAKKLADEKAYDLQLNSGDDAEDVNVWAFVSLADYVSIVTNGKNWSSLVIDDLGVERNSEYALGIIFSVIDRRIRSGRPLIIATNLPLSQIKSETMLDKRRMALLEKLDLAVDKDASDMCGRVGLGTSNITAHWGLTPFIMENTKTAL